MSSKKENFQVNIDPQYCKACRLCIVSCPQKVLEISDDFNHMGYRPVCYKGEGCIACGICYYSCPEPFAITITQKGGKDG